jgi:hypothetical protein
MDTTNDLTTIRHGRALFWIASKVQHCRYGGNAPAHCVVERHLVVLSRQPFDGRRPEI